MSKIEKLENRIIKEGMKDEDFEQFKILLRRTPSDFLKIQHCYITASSFPKENADQAIKLIKYGIENFSNDAWLGVYWAHLRLADIYYKIEQYDNAYQTLQKAVSILDDSNENYRISCAIDMMWLKMHIDNFEYSEELENFFITYQNENEFSKALRINQFKTTIAEIIIMLHYGKQENARSAYSKVHEIMCSEYKGTFDSVLKNHKISEKLEITTAVSEYLESIQSIIG